MSSVTLTLQPNTPTNLIGLVGEQIPISFTTSIQSVKVIAVVREKSVAPLDIPFAPSAQGGRHEFTLVNNDYGLQGQVNTEMGHVLINSDYDTIDGIIVEVEVTDLNRRPE